MAKAVDLKRLLLIFHVLCILVVAIHNPCRHCNDSVLFAKAEAKLRKHHEVHQSAFQALAQGVPPALVSFLDIRIRRDRILHDCLNQIRNRKDDLKKPLRVTFISNGVAEEGEDEGGLSKEFFQLVVIPYL